MTHNFVDDRLALDALLDTQVPYIGLLGPQKRFEEMLTAFDEEDRTFGDAELDRIFTPAGLNLGSETPYQIALSIVAEILAVDNDRTPQHLKEQNGPIHKRIEPERGHQNG
jgi:xanthine dehydrogenase accessory factor